MSKKWPGGIITPTPATPTGPYQNGSAPGIWTLSQQSYWAKQGLWPIAGNALQRGVFLSGNTSTPVNVIDYIDISTTGNATSFGSAFVSVGYVSGCGSTTRGVYGGGIPSGAATTTMQYITFAATGNSTSFGSLSAARYGMGACSNDTRGLFAAGQDGSYAETSTIYYITIATTGNTTLFGYLSATSSILSGCASSTRAIFNTASQYRYVTIATTGNSTLFGFPVAQAPSGGAGISSSTRGVFAVGTNAFSNVMEYVTIATTGNAVDFGDLTAGAYLMSGCSSNIRGVFSLGSLTGSVKTNALNYITIATTGNASSFGNLTNARDGSGAASNCSGGVQ